MQFSLNTVVIKPEKNLPITNAIILLHGYGGDGKDISMLTLNWKRFLPNTVFLCPDGHEICSINPSGFQWFDLSKDDKEYILAQSMKAEKILARFIDEVKKKYGEDQFLKWRRGYSTPPPALPIDSEMNPNKDDLYKGINNLPLTECLEDTYARVIPYWENSIKPLVLKNTTIISAHGNSLRALCKYLFDVSDEDITSLEIPTANPLVISLNNSCKIHSASYLDASRAQKLPIIGE